MEGSGEPGRIRLLSLRPHECARPQAREVCRGGVGARADLDPLRQTVALALSTLFSRAGPRTGVWGGVGGEQKGLD